MLAPRIKYHSISMENYLIQQEKLVVIVNMIHIKVRSMKS